MNLIHSLLDVVFHLKDHLHHYAQSMGPGLYVLLFVIVFCETGLVVTPFLPGDSLLFALGTLAANGHDVSLPLVAVTLCLAANCGDLVNYFIGLSRRPQGLQPRKLLAAEQKHLLEAQSFYERHGRKTIILARFVPIIRTFAPFVAGVGKMRFSRFIAFSVAGGVFWVVSVLMAGYLFGNIPFIDRHFELVVVAIVCISVVPVIFQWWKGRSRAVAEV